MTTSSARAAWLTLLRRFHFYIGLFVGPFIFIAALSGTLYVATPQLENAVYASALYSDAQGEAQPLARQVAAAQKAAGENLRLYAVRPASEAGETTRVMFADPALGPSETRGIFIDPVTLAVKGDMTVYGTSGILPLRQWIDYLHRSLLLGDMGRIYSELAASWMWVAAIGGIALWWLTRPKRQLRPAKKNAFARARGWHVTSGWLLMAGLLLFSATGLTWSQWAGANVDKLRAALGWLTPQVSTALIAGEAAPADPHAEHHMHHEHMAMTPQIDLSRLDAVLAAARQTGIDAAKVEIRPPRDAQQAWTVTEVDRRWPTQVDAVAIDGGQLAVVDKARFADFPLMAKLTRWGVDFHMGVLFGLPNQLALIAFGLGLCFAIIMGYRLWWLRRPRGAQVNPAATLSEAWLSLGGAGRGVTLLAALLLGFALPVMGVSLLLFFVIDMLRWQSQKRRLASLNG
ncbi:PepSY-associated TM helix domain-containing protein [Franconibacter helveticus]|uniref:PepSY-associated TM helix domain-containing protein n=1 Tax=Franconibacter helveticus TaxID=357240 RepID=UPI000DA17441|nr:PepSY-associated TM helix domain-containing protein [Franconibacter helveticus]